MVSDILQGFFIQTENRLRSLAQVVGLFLMYQDSIRGEVIVIFTIYKPTEVLLMYFFFRYVGKFNDSILHKSETICCHQSLTLAFLPFCGWQKI